MTRTLVLGLTLCLAGTVFPGCASPGRSRSDDNPASSPGMSADDAEHAALERDLSLYAD